MKKKLYVADVLMKGEIEILHKHFKEDELCLLRGDTDYSERYSDEELVNIAESTASRILEKETLKELLENDLSHVLDYNENYDYIIEKIEWAIEDDVSPDLKTYEITGYDIDHMLMIYDKYGDIAKPHYDLRGDFLLNVGLGSETIWIRRKCRM